MSADALRRNSLLRAPPCCVHVCSVAQGTICWTRVPPSQPVQVPLLAGPAADGAAGDDSDVEIQVGTSFVARELFQLLLGIHRSRRMPHVGARSFWVMCDECASGLHQLLLGVHQTGVCCMWQSGASDLQYSTVQYSNCGRGSQTSALASEPHAREGAQRAQ